MVISTAIHTYLYTHTQPYGDINCHTHVHTQPSIDHIQIIDNTILYYKMILHFTTLCYAILYYVILHYTILFYI